MDLSLWRYPGPKLFYLEKAFLKEYSIAIDLSDFRKDSAISLKIILQLKEKYMGWKIKLVFFSAHSYNVFWWAWIPLLI